MSEPLLSVCLITYNHAEYIKGAIDGVLMQKVNFNWELVIADDCSTDGTREILLEYRDKHPSFITLILQEKNVGPAKNYFELITTPKSKYIAYFEGDDFWIDSNKLQKQVDFLEANPDYSLCFHDAIVYWENKILPPYYFCKELTKTTFYIDDVIKGWFLPSASMVFRKDLLHPLPCWFNYTSNGDYALQLLLVLKGKFYFINQPMSIYRQTNSNFSATIDSSRVNKNLIQLFNYYNEFTNNEFSKLIEKRLKKLYGLSSFYKFKELFGRSATGKKLWKMLSFIFHLIKNK
jgi:glycosyltransferase involved in cell wall biosynthesis